MSWTLWHVWKSERGGASSRQWSTPLGTKACCSDLQPVYEPSGKVSEPCSSQYIVIIWQNDLKLCVTLVLGSSWFDLEGEVSCWVSYSTITDHLQAWLVHRTPHVFTHHAWKLNLKESLIFPYHGVVQTLQIDFILKVLLAFAFIEDSQKQKRRQTSV